MKDQDEGEIEIRMDTSDDNKIITLVFVSDLEMDTNDFILALESYLTDLTKAAYQRIQPDVGIH